MNHGPEILFSIPSHSYRIYLAWLMPLPAALVQWHLWSVVQPFPWFFLFPSLLLALWMGGLRGAVGALTVSILLGWYLFIPPYASFAIARPAGYLMIVGFSALSYLLLYHYSRKVANAAQLQAVIENFDGLSWSLDRRYRLLTANRAFFDYVRKHLGVELAVGHIFPVGALTAEVRESWYARFARVLAGERLEFEINASYSDAGAVFEFSLSPVYGEDGKVIGLVGRGKEITERLRLQRILGESEERYRLIELAARMGIWEFDFQVNKIYWSEAAAQLFGVPLELLGHSPEGILRLVHPDDVAACTALMDLGRHQSGIYDIKCRIIRPDGTVRWMWANGGAIHQEGTAAPRFLGIVMDITEETQFRERTSEIEQMNSSLQAEIARGEQLQRNLNALTAMLVKTEERERRRIATEVHDEILQNLVYAVMKLGELRSAPVPLAEKQVVEEVQGYVQKTIKELRGLVYELSPPVLYELGLFPAVRWLVRQFQEKYDLAVTYQEEVTADIVEEETSLILYQALRELLNNVIRHAQAQGAGVTLASDGQKLKLIVEDDGRGFNTDQIDWKRENPMGFGLINIRQRLESIEGRLNIESQAERGTRVEIVVPLIRSNR